MKNLILFLWMILSSMAMMAKGSSQPNVTVNTLYISNLDNLPLTTPGVSGLYPAINMLKYKGKQFEYCDSTFRVIYQLQVNSPTRIKCSLYLIKSDFNDGGKRGYMQEIRERPGSSSPALTDLTHLEKIYEFPEFTVTKDTLGAFNWDGYTNEINGKRYLVRDQVAMVFKNADTGELYLTNGNISFSPVGRYGDTYGGDTYGSHWGIFQTNFTSNQHSVSANVFFKSALPAKNVTVFLAQDDCYIGALSTNVVNQGGKAIVEDMYKRGGDDIIGYKELGPIPGNGQISDFMWDSITDMKGNVFIPDPNDPYPYTLGLILEGEDSTVNMGLIEGCVAESASTPPMPKDYQNREPNVGAPYNVEVPGTLANLLGAGIDTITTLSLSGTINGYDIATIHQMKKLTVLDLSKADIVTGGDPYSDYYTKEDIVSNYMLGGLSLISLSLPNNAYTFESDNIDLGNSLTTIIFGINTQYFSPNFSLYNFKEFIVPDKNPYFSSIDGVLFNKDNTTLTKYPTDKTDGTYTIPNGVTTIGTSAFQNCFNLTKVIIPKSITTINTEFSMGCISLSEVYCYNPVPPYINYYYGTCFDDITTTNGKLYVPQGSKAAYASADGWKEFTNIIEMSETSIDVISQNAQETTLAAWMQNGTLHVSGLTAGKSWSVYDVSGKLVSQGIANSEKADIPLFESGVYLVSSGDNTVKVINK